MLQTTSASADSAAYGQAYYNFAKRTGAGLENLMGPVMTALNKGKQRYSEEEEEEEEQQH